jgi:hypothetical protein
MGQQPNDPPGSILKAYGEGIDNEPIILSLLQRDYVWRVLGKDELSSIGYQFGEWNEERGVDYREQVRVELKIGERIVIGAHLDGIAECLIEGNAIGFEQHCVVEVKAFGDGFWKRFKKEGVKGFPGYQWQVSVQMHGTGLPLLFVVGHKGSDGKVFEILTETVLVPPIGKGMFAAKLGRIEKAVALGDAGSSGLQCPTPFAFPCPYYPLHDGEQDQIYGAVPSGTEQPTYAEANEAREVDSLAGQYNETREQIEILEVRRKGIVGSLIEKFDKVNGDKDVVGGKKERVKKFLGSRFTVSDVVTVRTGGLDEEAMVKEGVNVEKYRKPGSSSRSIRVTERKTDEGK